MDGDMNPDPFAEFAAPVARTIGNITYHDNLEQGTEAWLQARCGLLTASEMKLILTPTLKIAANDKTRAHLYELLSQRISRYVEPTYIGDDMLRGMSDEVDARMAYSKHHASVQDTGFLTNSKWGFTLGYSPDGLVGADGLIECKSRKQKYQVQTFVENVLTGTAPDEYMMQLQTGLLVSERKWIDFISYSGGLPMAVIRVYPDDAIQSAIVEAAAAFEAKLAESLTQYHSAVASMSPLIETKRTIIQEIYA